MSDFEICVALKKYAFPESRLEDAYYFLRPDMMLKMSDIDAVKDLRKRGWSDFGEIVFYPMERDLLNYLGTDLQQIQRMSDFTFFAYLEQDRENQEAFRARGDSVWEALAKVILARFEDREEQMPKVDVSGSENTVQVSSETIK